MHGCLDCRHTYSVKFVITIRSADTFFAFKNRLKTELFQSCYS